MNKSRNGKTAPFAMLPHEVLDRPSYRGLSAGGKALLVDLARQINGKQNNGRLVATWAAMEPRGWRSKHTLYAALDDLIAADLVVQTRKGRRPNRASLYALSWLPFKPFDEDAEP